MKNPKILLKAVLSIIMLMFFAQGCNEPGVDLRSGEEVINLQGWNEYYNARRGTVEPCKSVCLVAGKYDKIGTVDVYSDDSYLTIVYKVSDEGVFLHEVHLEIFNSLDELEEEGKLSNGGPKLGKFEYKMEWEAEDNVSEHKVQIPWDKLEVGDCFFIAAHAELTNDESAWAGLCSPTDDDHNGYYDDDDHDGSRGSGDCKDKDRKDKDRKDKKDCDKEHRDKDRCDKDHDDKDHCDKDKDHGDKDDCEDDDYDDDHGEYDDDHGDYNKEVSLSDALQFPGCNWAVYFEFCRDECTEQIDFTYGWEDLRDEGNDADYNDLLMKSSIVISGNEAKMIFIATARGAKYDHTFKIRIPKMGIADISGDEGVEEDGDYYNITVFRSTKEALPPENVSPHPFAANTTKDDKTCDPIATKVIYLSLNDDFTISGAKPFEPFITVWPSGKVDNGDSYDLYIWEISGRDTWMKDGKEYPNGIMIPFDWKWPNERQNVNGPYPDFMDITNWNPDWYNNLADPSLVWWCDPSL